MATDKVMKNLKHHLVFIFIGLSLILSCFQNCSAVRFSQTPDSSVTEQPDPATSNRVLSQNLSTQQMITKADILFVLDESVSMREINSAVTTGFSRISTATFPADTRMAVTNMAPAFFDNPNALSINFNLPWNTSKPEIGDQPGFIRLINGNSIQNFRSKRPNLAGQFPHAGCNETWLRPNDVNSQGQNCLVAHSQVASIGIGVEAGTISLQQLAIRYRLANTRLFREGALVNIVFVSDTHEPGVETGFFGTAGAPSRAPTLSDLQSAIEESSPGILGIKMHGIVPLPPAGDPRLANIHTIGRLPQNSTQSRVSSEQLHDYSYLPFIRETNGIAAHPLENDWAVALQEMVQEFPVQYNPRFVLPEAISTILSVRINGELVTPERYRLEADRRALIITTDPSWGANISVTVQYQVPNS